MARTRFALALSLATVMLTVLALAGPASARDKRAPWEDPWGAPPWMLGAAPPPGALSAGFRHPCSGLGVRWIGRATSFAGGLMELTPEQEAKLQSLEDSARAAGEDLHDVCRDAVDWEGTAPERLKAQQEILAAAQKALGDVRPKFEAFYTTLNARQKDIMDDVLAGHRSIPWGWWYQDY